MKIEFFRKRSGKIVKFNPEKIRSAVSRAIAEADAILPKPLPENLDLYIKDKVLFLLDYEDSEFYVKPDTVGSRVPKLEDVQDAVEYSLQRRWQDRPVGYGDTEAKLLHDLYANYRKEREKARAALRVVRKEKSKVDVTDKGMLLQEGATGTLDGWDRSRLEKDLEDVLPDSEKAPVIAKRVERAILKSGLRTVSSDLVTEMANNELTAMGIPARLNSGRGYFVDKDFIDGLMYAKSRENSNVTSNNPEAINMAMSEYLLKNWAFDNVFSKDVVHAHQFGLIYLHDLGSITKVYCSSHSIEYLKKYGLRGLVNLNTQSKPARSASVLTGHINTFLASMQAYYAGALGLGYVNVFYAPYLTGKTDKELHQIAQEFIFNCSQNAFSRGAQSLFIDANICTGIPKALKDTPAIGPGGKYQIRLEVMGEPFMSELMEEGTPGTDTWRLYHDWNGKGDKTIVAHEEKGSIVYDNDRIDHHVMRYSDYEEEAQRFANALLDVWGEGDANGHIFEFPKCDFHVCEETFSNPREKRVYDHACEVAAKNGSVYFVFDRESYSTAACCRLRISLDKALFIHPESMRSSFPRNFPIVIKRYGLVEVISMGRLFDETESDVSIEDDFEIKYLDDVEIWDRDGWTPLHRVMRHKKTPKMRSDMLTAVRTDSGRMTIVTDNHPMVVVDTNTPSTCPKCGANAMSPFGHSAYGKHVFHCSSCNRYSVFERLSVNSESEKIVEAEFLTKTQALINCKDVSVRKEKTISFDQAYLLGAYVGDGSMYPGHGVTTISKPCEHRTASVVRDHALAASRLLGMDEKRVHVYKDRVAFPTALCYEMLSVGHNAYLKQLPSDYLSWTEKTFGDVVSGLIDTDGSIHKTDVLIASISLTLITQLQMYLRSIDIPSRMYIHNEHPVFDNSVNGKEGFTDTHLAYVLSIRNDQRARDLFRLSWKVQSAELATTIKPKWTSCERVCRKQHVTDKCEEYVYDITTGSHTFVVNGLLEHNCGFQNVTINLPQCSYRTDVLNGLGDPREGSHTWWSFIGQVDAAMDLAVKAHLQKKKHIAKLMSGPDMPLWQIGKPACDGKPYVDLDKCVYIIGLIGLDDACRRLFGKSMHEDEELTTWGLSVIAHMNLRVKQYSKDYGLSFTLEESPAESAARRLARSDLAHFPTQAKDIVNGSEGNEYYTNSVHIPADASVPAIERIQRQAMFHGMIDSGAMTHLFIGEESPSAGAISYVVEQTFRLTQSAQITFSPEFTYCNVCGNGQRGLHDVCNVCGSHDVFGETRVVGYFSKIQNWNRSKRYGELVARHRGNYSVKEAGK